MEKISKQLNTKYLNQLVPTGINKSNPTGTTGSSISTKTDVLERSKTKYEPDFLLEDLQDLCNSEYRAWYCKVFHKLGKERVMQLASEARGDGADPARLFSFLLKKNTLQ